MAVVLFRPHLPVGARPAEICIGSTRRDEVLPEGRDLAEARAHAQPVAERPRLVGCGGADVERNRAIDRALFDRMFAQNPILRVHPRAGGAVALLAVGPARDAVVGAGLAADQEVAVRFVRDDCAVAGLVENRVADVRAFDVPVVMEEGRSHLEPGRRGHRQVADEPVAGEVDEVLEVDRDAQFLMAHRHVADERVLDVRQLALPRRIFKPGKPAVDEEADVADVAHGVIRVAHTRVVDIADRIRRIESD